MINIYNGRTTAADIEKLGKTTVQAFRADVHCADNGSYYLDLECPVEYSEYIFEDEILSAESPSPDGTIRKQLFRVSEVERRRKKLKARCWHISYDTKRYVVAEYIPTEGMTCAQAVAALQSATDVENPFILTCDINDPITMTFVRMTLFECLEKICQYFKAHIIRDNRSIHITRNNSDDFGARIAYGKNLKDISCYVDWSEVCTKVLPVGEDDITLDDLYVNAVDIDGLTEYDYPFTKVVKFDQDNELTEKIERSDFEKAEEDAVLNGNNLRESDYANRSDYTAAVQAAYWQRYKPTYFPDAGDYPSSGTDEEKSAADKKIKDAKNAVVDAAYNAARAAVLKPNLLLLAQSYLKAHNVPSVKYTIKADVPEITYLGQVGHLYDKSLGISDLEFTLTEFEYDCILGKMTQFTYGDVVQPLIGAKTDSTSYARSGVTAAKGNIQLMENGGSDTYLITEDNRYILTEFDQYIPVEE